MCAKTFLAVIVLGIASGTVVFAACVYIQDLIRSIARTETAKAILEYRKRLAKANKGKNIRF